MIGRCALGRAPIPCRKSFAARGSFGRGHRCAIPYIDDVNIHLTGIAFAGSRIFTLSALGGAIQVRGRLGRRASYIAITTRFRDPGPPPPPHPPDRVRARPVLPLEEPAATLPPQLTIELIEPASLRTFSRSYARSQLCCLRLRPRPENCIRSPPARALDAVACRERDRRRAALS